VSKGFQAKDKHPSNAAKKVDRVILDAMTTAGYPPAWGQAGPPVRVACYQIGKIRGSLRDFINVIKRSAVRRFARLKDVSRDLRANDWIFFSNPPG
jgi:hypothetical protein